MSTGLLDPMLDDPCQTGLISGFCSSGLNSRHGLPSDSTSRWTPLLRRTVPLITARGGLSPPEYTTCLAHKKKGLALLQVPLSSGIARIIHGSPRFSNEASVCVSRRPKPAGAGAPPPYPRCAWPSCGGDQGPHEKFNARSPTAW